MSSTLSARKRKVKESVANRMMTVLPQTPLDMGVARGRPGDGDHHGIGMQDFFIDSGSVTPDPGVSRISASGFAVTHFGVLIVRGSDGPNWAIAGIGLYYWRRCCFSARSKRRGASGCRVRSSTIQCRRL